MARILLTALGLSLSTPLFVSSAATAQSLDRILAVVSGHVIMLSDIRAFLELGLIDVDPTAADAEQVALERLIERRLVLDEVDRYRVPPPPPAQIERGVAELRLRSSRPDAFTATLDRLGLATDDLRQILGDEARREAYLVERFGGSSELTERQLREYYEERASELTLDGRPLTFDEARGALREQLVDERRRALVADWVEGLLRRGQVVRFGPGSPEP